MRYSYYILLVIVCYMLSSCHSNNSKHMDYRLESIWKMSDDDLDGAIMLAKQIEDSVYLCAESTKKKYDLLNIRLRDKQGIVPSSTDSAKTIAKYFEEHGEPKDRMRAYHYLSSAYRDFHDSPNAILFDLKAIEAAETQNIEDSAMLEKAYSQLSTLYRQQLNMEKSIEMAKKHYDISCDKIWAAMDIANAYFFCNDTVHSLQYYDECYAVLARDKDFNYNPALHSELLARYSIFGIPEKADSLYRLLKLLPRPTHPQNLYSALGEYFINRHEIDSALHYYKLDLESNFSYGQKCDASYAIMNCYKENPMVDSIAKYAFLFAQYNDSVISERRFEQTVNADAEYRYRRNVEEEKRILQRDEILKKRIYTISLLLIMIILGGSVFYFYRRKKMLELILSKEQQIENYTQEIAKKEDSIKSAKEAIDNLDMQLSELYSQIGKKQIQNDTLLQLALMRKVEDNASEVIEKFKKASSGQYPLTENEWKDLMSAIDRIYPEFKSLLQHKIPRLSKPIIQTAYMMKAGMSNPQIASSMDIPRQTVWYRSNAIKKALGDDLQVDIDSI